MISILHLSDIHFSENRNVIVNRIDKIFDSIKNEIKGKKAIFIVTSGDIAYSGKESEYKIAKEFYNNLFKKIKAYCDFNPYLLFVPGNHDCLFDESKETIRRLVLKDFYQNEFANINETQINLCCEPQDQYFSFAQMKLSSGDVLFENKLLRVITFKLMEKL